MIKKIYSIVSDKVFYDFRNKAYAQRLSLGDALTLLAEGYAKGEIVLNSKQKVEKEVVENIYLKEKKNNSTVAEE